MMRKLWMLPLCLLLAMCVARGEEAAKPAFAIAGTTDKEVAIYLPNETVTFTLKVLDKGQPVGGHKVKWSWKTDSGEKAEGEGVAPAEGLKVTAKTAKPGFIHLYAQAFDENGKKLQGYVGGWGANKHGSIFFEGGACVEPEKLASAEEPTDFDAFWKGMKEELAKVPMQADVKELEWKHKNIKLYAVKIPCAGPRPVTGYLMVPANAKEKSLPAALYFHGYGNSKHNRPDWVDGSKIVFNVNAHGMELEQGNEYYANFSKSTNGYAFSNEENADPKKCYFYGMSLRLLRAFEFVKTLKEWDGKNLGSNGGSQGGLQGLWGAALVPEVTSAEIWSPWCCDLAGITQGRMRGWRPDFQPALNYYDPVFMAKRIKTAKVNLIANYGDYTCPPSSVWIVYNNLATPNKSMEVRQGCTHAYMMKNYQKYVLSPSGISGVEVKK